MRPGRAQGTFSGQACSARLNVARDCAETCRAADPLEPRNAQKSGPVAHRTPLPRYALTPLARLAMASEQAPPGLSENRIRAAPPGPRMPKCVAFLPGSTQPAMATDADSDRPAKTPPRARSWPTAGGSPIAGPGPRGGRSQPHPPPFTAPIPAATFRRMSPSAQTRESYQPIPVWMPGPMAWAPEAVRQGHFSPGNANRRP